MTPGQYIRARRIAHGLTRIEVSWGAGCYAWQVLAIEWGILTPDERLVGNLARAIGFPRNVFDSLDYPKPLRHCRKCGCSQFDACVGQFDRPCAWSESEANLCTSCEDRTAGRPHQRRRRSMQHAR